MKPNDHASTIYLYGEDSLQWSYVKHWESGQVHLLYLMHQTPFALLELHCQYLKDAIHKV